MTYRIYTDILSEQKGYKVKKKKGNFRPFNNYEIFLPLRN
jgi:hypothetical protein